MIPARLLAVAEFISDEDVVADIGSDHGLLPLLLVKRGHTYVYASENKRGPYTRLKAATSAAKEVIEVDLADGIKNLPKTVNTLVIAGMGGSLITEILLKYPQSLKNIRKLVLAPQGSEKEVRLTLNKLNFMIVDEKLVVDSGHYYEVVVSRPGKQTLTGFEAVFGPINLKAQSNEFKAKWERIYRLNENILSKPNLTSLKRERLSAEQRAIKEALEER